MDTTPPSALGAFATGLALGAGLIVAIGAQNAYVLRMGLARQHVTPLALLAGTVDALLIAAGLLGLGALVQAHPAWGEAMRWAGVMFLTCYGLLAFRRAWLGGALAGGEAVEGASLKRALLTLLGFSLLNPHVYLDTVVLLGAVGAQQPPALRPAFGAGAMLASYAWFLALGHGARWLAPWLRTERAWRVLDAIIGLTMLVLALLLSRG